MAEPEPDRAPAAVAVKTIVRDQPFRDGEHCVLYGAEPGELARAVRAALADKPRLARMGAAAAEHSWSHHTAKARAERVALAALGRRLDGRYESDLRATDGKSPAGSTCASPARPG